MSSKLFLTVTAALYGMSAALFSLPVRAETTLKSAEIREVIRQVRLQPRNQNLRDAAVRDKMFPEDALWTSKRSRAGLRFNDGSYARVGELALFRFTPGTRNFRLNNGTVLLLIKPGQGSTRIDTPNASAGVRGSALFVRYDEKTKTTLVGALTNNPAGPMEITAANGEKQALEAGQMAVIDQTGFIRRYRFDIPTFYETSDMVRGLDLPLREKISPDPAIAAVQRETADALRQQKPLDPIATIENPSNTKLSPSATPLFNNGNLSNVANTNVPQPPSATVGKSPDNPTQTNTPTTTSPTAQPTANPQPTETPTQTKPNDPASPPTLVQPNPGDPTPQPTLNPAPSPQPSVAPSTPATTPNPAPVTVPSTPVTTPNLAPITIPNPAPVTTPSPTPVRTPSLQPTQTPSRQQLESTGGQAATKDPSAAAPGSGGNTPGTGGTPTNPVTSTPVTPIPATSTPNPVTSTPNPATPTPATSTPATSTPNPQPVTTPNPAPTSNPAPTQPSPSQPVETPSTPAVNLQPTQTSP